MISCSLFAFSYDCRCIAAVDQPSDPASSEVFRLLLKATKDPDYGAREDAFRAMAALPQEEIFPRFEDFLRDKEHSELRAVALDDPHWSVRHAAIHALARIGDQGCAAQILGKLDDPEDIVKKEAIAALGLLGSREAACSILALINHEGLQPAVLESLEMLGIPDSDQFQTIYTRSNTRLRCSLIDLAVTLKDTRVVDFLCEALDKEIPVIRSRIVTALGELGDKKATPMLRRIKKEDPDKGVRKDAGRALKRLPKKPTY
ncbi:MAG: HEAT repeat domain-containing protein [bacterium]